MSVRWWADRGLVGFEDAIEARRKGERTCASEGDET